MAKQEDGGNPKGRLLFTDFEFSGKGQPPGVSFDEPERPAAARSSTSFQDLLSTLDFGFEEDEGDEPAPETTPAADDAGQDFEPDQPIPDEPDEPSGFAGPQAPPRISGRGRATSEPQAPARTARIEEVPPVLESGEPDLGAIFAQAAGLFPDDGDEPEPEDGQEDWEAEALDDGSWAESFDQLLDTLENDGDLLSAVPAKPAPPADETLPRNPRRRRLGVRRARTRAYGGIKRLDEWYRPPKEDPGGTPPPDRMERVENWYEPPPRSGMPPARKKRKPDAAGPAGKTRVPDSTDDLFGSPGLVGKQDAGIDEPGGPGSGKTRLIRDDDVDGGARTGEDDYGEETEANTLFNSFDLEGEWNARIDESDLSSPGKTMIRQAYESNTIVRPHEKPGAGEAAAGRTRQTPGGGIRPGGNKAGEEAEADDLFSSLDLEGEWGARIDESDLSSPGRTMIRRSYESNTIARPLEKFDADAQDDANPHGNESGETPPDESGSASPIDQLLFEDDEEPAFPDPESGQAETENAVKAEETQPAGDPDATTADQEDAGGSRPGPDADGDDAAAAYSGADGPRTIGGYRDSGDDKEPVAMRAGMAGAAAPGAPKGEAAAPGEDEDYIPGDETPAAAPEAEGPEAEGRDAEAVNPLDVFANMDAFEKTEGDSLDDEIRSMLAEDAAGEKQAAPDAEAPAELTAAGAIEPGGGGTLRRMSRRVLAWPPVARVRRLGQTIAWRENWRLYCDLAAILISTASFAVIVAYFLWYRN